MIVLDNVPPDLQAEYTLAYEARAIHDTATLDLRDYQNRGQPDWIVAAIKPAPGSGSATVPGGYMKAETGEFVAPPQAGAVLLKHGNWRLLASASGTAPAGGPYAWSQPLTRQSRVASPEDIYSPFAHGGTVVFMHVQRATGLDEFAKAKLMMPAWAGLVPEAMRAAPRLLDLSAQVGTSTVALPEIGRMVADANGLTATLAMRTALQSATPFAGRSRSLLSAAEVNRLSVFTYLILAMATVERTEWAAQLASLVQATNDLDRFTAMAQAAFAVTLFKPQSAAAIEDAQRLLRSVHARVSALQLSTSPAGQLDLIFKKSGLS